MDENVQEPVRPIQSEDKSAIGLIPERYVGLYQPKVIGNEVRSPAIFFRPEPSDADTYAVVIQYPGESEMVIKVPRREITGISLDAFSRKG